MGLLQETEGPVRRRADRPTSSPRVTCDGKFFAIDGRRFRFQGVTYGTFRPRGDGALFPERSGIKSDLARIAEAGFTVVRTYTPPPDDMIELAAEWGLRLFAGSFYLDWRYLVGTGARRRRRIEREARDVVRRTARRLKGIDTIAALSLGNEVPADVVRWFGARHIERTVAELVETVRAQDPELLVTYGNYPTTEYLSFPTLDFVTFNVFLEQQQDFRRYLSRLHNLVADRPLVIGEIGLDAGAGEEHQAATVDWQLETALERAVAGTCIFSWTDEWWVGDAPVDGWRFGMTCADRSPRPALGVATAWNDRSVADLRTEWPSITVVVCAYNAEETLDECLRHLNSLDYPALETIVVDDGSNDATAAIASRYADVEVVSSGRGGLGSARNIGYQASSGEIVAYIDADAYPSSEWPYYIALGFDDPNVGAVGGDNRPPIDDPLSAQRVARSPGGPVHVLLADDRAEHIPGCNMAFRREALEALGGFDTLYRTAGDDVDICWRLLDKGWTIGFHPGALVWHHRRSGARAYVKQQVGYGRAEALVQARHPDRFTAIGTARWRGIIYNALVPTFSRRRVYRGVFGSAPFQSVYRGGGHALDVAHQVGIPLVALAIVLSVLTPVSPGFGVAAIAAAVYASILGLVDAMRSGVPRSLRRGKWRFRAGVAGLHLMQPLARTWGRLANARSARAERPSVAPLEGPIQTARSGVIVLPATGDRVSTVMAIVANLRKVGLSTATVTGWEAHDALIFGSRLVAGRLITSAHPEGCIQVRVRWRLRRWATIFWTLVVAIVTSLSLAAGVVLALALAADTARGMWRLRRGVRWAIREGIDASRP